MEHKYLFSKTEKLIIEFGNTINLNPDLTEKSKSSYLRAYPSLFHSVFAEIDLETMTRESLGQTLVACADICSGRRLSSILAWVKRFLLFLLDINFYSDRRFDFLRCYEFYLKTSENQFIIDILLRTVYQNDFTAKAINSFLYSMSTDQNFTHNTKLSLRPEAKKYLAMVFKNVNVENMDRFQLGHALLNSTNHLSKQEQNLAQKYTRRFLYYLIDQGFYHDKRFDYLQYYRNLLEARGDLLPELLLSDYPFQYRIVTLQNGKTLSLFIGSTSEAVCDVLTEAMRIFTHTSMVKSFNECFEESLRPYVVTSVEDFSWQTFMTQCAYLRKKQANRWVYSYLVTIYNLIAQKYNNQIFHDAMISTALLSRPGLAAFLYNGYEAVALNPAEKPPEGDKLLVCLGSGPTNANTSYYATNSKAIDFSAIATPEYKDMLKDYLWHASPSFAIRANTCLHGKIFFSFLEDLQSKKKLSIYYIHHNDVSIQPNECMAYVQYIKQTYTNAGTCQQYIFAARSILQHAIDMNCTFVDPLCIFYLSTYSDHSNTSNPLNDECLHSLSKTVNQKAHERTENALMACIYYLMLTTECRISQIIALNKNCVRSAMKSGEFMLVSQTKTSYGEQTEIPITLETKKHIDVVLSLTEEWRAQCSNKDIANKLFIVPSSRKHAYTTISRTRFNAFLSNCCREAGVQEYTASNLRDTHMTKAEEVCIRNNMSDLHKLILSGHAATATAERHYIKTDIISLLEAAHGLIIGDVQVAGQILNDDTTMADAASVANQCGYCGKSACESYSYLSCLLCRSFIATRSQLPFFNSEIARIEAKIQQTTTPHDTEDLRNIQRLLLAYLARLLREEDIHVFNS